MSLHRLIFVAMSLSLAACTIPAGTDQAANVASEEPDPRRGEEVRQICFGSSISGFQNATKTSVVLSRGSKDYLVTTRQRCHDLEYADSLALRSFSGCLSRGDKLIGFDSPFGRNNTAPSSIACYVDKIYVWDEDAGEDDMASDEPTEETVITE